MVESLWKMPVDELMGLSLNNVMDATTILKRIAEAFHKIRLEAVMVGNAAAALHGSPVSTLDIDFMFRKTPVNLRKLKALADELGGSVLKPFYPASDMYRVVNDESGLQLDFMSILHGIRSFEYLKSDAVEVEFGGHPLKVASLEKIIQSKKALGRPRDMVVLEILERTLHEKRKKENRSIGSPEEGK